MERKRTAPPVDTQAIRAGEKSNLQLFQRKAVKLPAVLLVLISMLTTGCATRQLIHQGADVRVVSAVDAQPVSGAEVEFQFEMGTQHLDSPGYTLVGLFAGPLLSPEVIETDRDGRAVLEPLFYERDPFSPEGRFVSGMRSRKEIERVQVRREGYQTFDSGDRFHYGPDADGGWITQAEDPEFWERFPRLVVELSPEVTKPSSKPNL